MSRNYFRRAAELNYDEQDEQDETSEPKYQCRHIFTDGHRCGSPGLRNEKFCYYHHNNRRPVKRNTAIVRNGEHSNFTIPMPDDRGAIQHSIGNILQGLASDTLDTRRAGLMLYGLQTASHNLPREATNSQDRPIPPPTVDEVVDDPELGLIAPESQWDPNHGRKKDPAAALIQEWRKMLRAKAEREQAEPTPLIPPPL
jgi:hypothetical protein